MESVSPAASTGVTAVKATAEVATIAAAETAARAFLNVVFIFLFPFKL
jgi:hypothetical protein